MPKKHLCILLTLSNQVLRPFSSQLYLSITVSVCFQSDSYTLNDTQLSMIPLDEFGVERETQFQEPPAEGASRQDQG